MFKTELLEIVNRKGMRIEEKSLVVNYEPDSKGLNIAFRAPSAADSSLTISDLDELKGELEEDAGLTGKCPILWGKAWSVARASQVKYQSTIQIHCFFDFNLNQSSKLSLEIAVPRVCQAEGLDTKICPQ